MTLLEKFVKAANLAYQYSQYDVNEFMAKTAMKFLQEPDFYSTDHTQGGYWGSFIWLVVEQRPLPKMYTNDLTRQSDSEYEDAYRYSLGNRYGQ